jgi:hypothetical protein
MPKHLSNFIYLLQQYKWRLHIITATWSAVFLFCSSAFLGISFFLFKNCVEVGRGNFWTDGIHTWAVEFNTWILLHLSQLSKPWRVRCILALRSTLLVMYSKKRTELGKQCDCKLGNKRCTSYKTRIANSSPVVKNDCMVMFRHQSKSSRVCVNTHTGRGEEYNLSRDLRCSR